MHTKNRTVLRTLQEGFLWFMLYAVFGWLYEVALEVFIYHWGFSNRGVLFGPYLPIYGFGALAFLLTVNRLIAGREIGTRLRRLPAVFLGSMLIATAIELVTSYLLEMLTGAWPWQTYADYAVNFQARIALSPSIRFGIGGILFLYLLQPLFERLTGRVSDKTLCTCSSCIAIVVAADLIHTILALF